MGADGGVRLCGDVRACSYVGMFPTPQQKQTTTPALIPSPLLFVALTCGAKFSVWPAPPDSRRAPLGVAAAATMTDAAADAAADGTGAVGAAAPSPPCSTCSTSSAAVASAVAAAAAVVVRSIVLVWVAAR